MSRQTSRAELLRPSLGHDQPAQAPYTSQAGFITAFFGGPAAALMMGALNAHRLHRLQQDLTWIIAALAGWIGVEYWLTSPTGRDVLLVLKDWIGVKPEHTVSTLLGLLCFGLCSLAHARQERMASMMGLDRPKGLWMGVLLIVLGSVVGGLIRISMS